MIAINAIYALAALSAVAVIIYGPWQEVCTAYARQVVFEKRDAIFDIAAAGGLSFNSDEYRTIRILLEKTIRFAHEITVPRLVFYYVLLRLRGRKISGSPELIKVIERITDTETRAAVSRLVEEALDALAIMALLKSPVALLLIIPVRIIALFTHIGKCLRDHSQIIIQMEAERVGSSLDVLAA